MHIGVTVLKWVSRRSCATISRISNFFYHVLFKLIGYRKEVVVTNLKNSFPEKSDQEIEDITQRFFRFLADMFMEAIKFISMSDAEFSERFKTVNIEESNQYFDQGKSIVTVLGHYGNWEYLVSGYARDSKHTILGVYKPLSDPNYEALLATYRTRYGMVLVPLYDAYPIIEEYIKKGEKVAIMLIGDQTPLANRGYWMDFLNQDTPVFRGAEKLAVQYDLPVVFATLDRVKRGYYEMRFEPVFTQPRETEEGEITEFHTKKLEAQIKAKPYLWLWSHKRWTHKRPADTPDRFISKRYPGQ
jgi:KDO2-lipid IV(A) lauroyltransferase